MKSGSFITALNPIQCLFNRISAYPPRRKKVSFRLRYCLPESGKNSHHAGTKSGVALNPGSKRQKPLKIGARPRIIKKGEEKSPLENSPAGCIMKFVIIEEINLWRGLVEMREKRRGSVARTWKECQGEKT
ncbi:hypothetical protein Desku_2037 [Desulfofundulus kuznetsovii DSM 6115]|uniref:Uncharacterized protein n=1 Tax=Desulfofundulus kuznetsovii (strain DSM 6115 / VKM B-1805 / 17) TaxID=760568 RepID=A0AAU8PZH4_DESK7|nr:hypothetical protein Desku_2037 [Desulfofundulus kuznetsovii DSM 6115]